MISLIVCSLTPGLQTELLANIEATIGVPYEIICVDNSDNRYSIFSAYNYGASRAKYDLLCFMHGDICYHSSEWGKIVADKLQDPETGVLGIAGALFKSEDPSPWWITNSMEWGPYLRYNLLQHYKAGLTRKQEDGGNKEETWNEVVIVDGVWMCCRKDLWSRIPFDEKTYKGFHFYDLDFSLSAFAGGYKNFVSQEVLIEHFSAGFLDSKWIEAAKVFHRKWGDILPARIVDIPQQDVKRIRHLVAREFLGTMTFNKYHNLGLWLKYWWRVFVHAPFAKDTFMAVYHYGRSYVK